MNMPEGFNFVVCTILTIDIVLGWLIIDDTYHLKRTKQYSKKEANKRIIIQVSQLTIAVSILITLIIYKL